MIKKVKTIVLNGLLVEIECIDNYTLVIENDSDDYKKPLLETLLSHFIDDYDTSIDNVLVSVRYATSDKPITDFETTVADFFAQLDGEMELEYYQDTVKLQVIYGLMKNLILVVMIYLQNSEAILGNIFI